MIPYSHVVVASQLESVVRPEDPPEYYWGAVAPDVRYLAAMRREQTHIPTQRIAELYGRYPHLGSFLQGYLVHSLADQVDLAHIFFQHLPFSLLKGTLTHRHVAVVLELYHLESQQARPHLSGTYNEVFSELGLSESVSLEFARSVRRYITSASQWRLLDLARLLGLENDSRTDLYAGAADRFQRNWLLKNALFLGIRAGRIDKQIASKVASLYRDVGW